MTSIGGVLGSRGGCCRPLESVSESGSTPLWDGGSAAGEWAVMSGGGWDEEGTGWARGRS